jgi:biotin carboxyl carrier protein
VSVPQDRKAAAAERATGQVADRAMEPTFGPAPDHTADHAGIERLVEGLVPALIAKLGTLNVGELEVRQDGWRVRLQRPPGASSAHGRRLTDRAGQRSHVGHESPGGPTGTRGTTHLPAAAHAGGSNGSGGPSLAAVGPGIGIGTDHGATAGSTDRDGAEDRPAIRGPIATSPAVGVFQPGSKAIGGTRVRAGDRLGVVDMLGIPQDVLAPADGIVVGVIVDAGTAVEYGQELVHIEAAGAVEAR